MLQQKEKKVRNIIA